MLTVAVPNKGALSDPAAQMLGEAGYRRRRERTELTLVDPAHDLEFFFLRPRDIATYVATGQLDLGITGRDLVVDSGVAVDEVLALGFGGSEFRYAAPPGTVRDVADLAGRRIATSYVGLVRADLAERGVQAEVVRLDGAVEIAVQLGVADAVADVVSTGTTFRRAGLELVGDVVLESDAVLVRRRGRGLDPAAERLVRRLRGVIYARQYVMIDYDVPRTRLDGAAAITPGFESPTVSDTQDPEWVAVRAMHERTEAHEAMDRLWDLGARAILVSEIAACRL